MKKLIIITLCAVITLSFAGCSNHFPSKDDPRKQASGGSQTIGGNVEIPSPFVDCETMTDAEKTAGFNVAVPEKIPEGYAQKLIQAVKNDMIQVFYKNGEKEILIRKAKGSRDISGDYNKYKENNTMTVNSLKVSTRGNDGKVNVAVWGNGEFTFAVLADGLDSTAIGDMIKNMNSDTGIGGNVEIPSPFVDCETMADAEKTAGFNVAVPEKMPEGYARKLIQAVKNDMIQVFYENGENEITVRKAKGSEDISGDYNEYKESGTVTVGSLKVFARGNDGKVNVATWVNGEHTYSITVNPGGTGLDAAAINEMAGGIR